jgi:hypothetical protein
LACQSAYDLLYAERLFRAFAFGIPLTKAGKGLPEVTAEVWHSRFKDRSVRACGQAFVHAREETAAESDNQTLLPAGIFHNRLLTRLPPFYVDTYGSAFECFAAEIH